MQRTFQQIPPSASFDCPLHLGVPGMSEIITKGDQVKVPGETLLDFTLQQNVSIPVQQN
jgi:hypothetical protein